MSESTAGRGAGNGAAGPPSFRPADPAPREPGLTMDSGLDKLKRARAAMAADPSAPAADPPERHQADDGGTNQRSAGSGDGAGDHFGFGEGEGEGGGDETFELTIDGRPQRLSRAELIQGYLRQDDYSRKTQQTAEQHRKAQETYQQFEGATRALQAKLAQYVTEAGREFAEPVDWVALARQDPLGYQEKRARFEALRDAEAEQARLGQLRQAQEAQRAEAMYRSGMEVLTRAVPGWRDPATRTKLQEDIRSYAKQVGYTDEELAVPVLDPRQLIVLHDAMNYRRLAGRKVTPNAPDATRPARGETPRPAPPQRQQEARRVFDERPTMRNAQQLVKTLRSQKPAGRR
ncbi:MAG TPA: hypothetical protein VGR63_15215 [Casimicrobiaceae bacterium]|jgi:hypothetical protein|nr:hypothetical protein [Casimicrobiaceae bacterium]